MAVRHHQHYRRNSIGSFNPSSCLRPLRTPDAITRCSDYDPATFSSSISSSQAFIVYPGSSSVLGSSSPAVGCLGQVKRSNSVKGRYAKLLKLSRMFSDRSMPLTLKISSRVAVVEEDEYYSTSGVVRIEDMDPPLPVVTKPIDAGAVSLWKRRRGGDDLKGLYI